MSTPSFVISIDLELRWGFREHPRAAEHAPAAAGARAAALLLLERCEARGIRATWAAVGLLMCDGRDAAQAAVDAHFPVGRERTALTAAIAAAGADEREAPNRWAPTLVRRIAAAEGQELACHSFGHPPMWARTPSHDEWRADLRAANAVAAAHGLHMDSLVFPQNVVPEGWLPIAAEEGYRVFRDRPTRPGWGHAGGVPGWARRALRFAEAHGPVTPAPQRIVRRGGLIALPPDHNVRARGHSHALAALRERRIIEDLDAAARAGRGFHLWLHPHNLGEHTRAQLAMLGRVFDAFEAHRDAHGMVSRTMREEAATRGLEEAP